jgi:hypothetical protein
MMLAANIFRSIPWIIVIIRGLANAPWPRWVFTTEVVRRLSR